MKKVFMVHGFMGTPNGGWRSWLMGELDNLDIYACALPMPEPDYPSKEQWVETINDAILGKTEETFLIGHSLGVPAILRYLEELPEDKKLGGVVLVSGPYKILNPENLDSRLRKIDNFLEKEFNFDYIKQKSDNFVVIHGENDDRVPFEHAEFISKNLNCKLISVPNGGHLNGRSGWKQLPQVFDALLEMLPPRPLSTKSTPQEGN